MVDIQSRRPESMIGRRNTACPSPGVFASAPGNSKYPFAPLFRRTAPTDMQKDAQMTCILPRSDSIRSDPNARTARNTEQMTDDMFTQLRTPRLCLRRFRESDAEAFAGYRSDPAVARFQSWDTPYPFEQASRFVSSMATAPADVPGEWLQVAVAIPMDGSLVGDCAFAPRADDARTVEIGYSIAPEHQGRGYAREVVASLLGYLFERLEKHRVTAACDPRNLPSVRVLEAVGMRREGHTIESTWSKGEWTDDLLFAILEREWR